MWDIYQYCPFCENTLLINILWSNPPPYYRLYSSWKGVVKIVQICLRDVQPEIMQNSNQIISRDRHDSSDLSAHKIPTFFYCIKVRGIGLPLNGGYVLLFQPSDSSTHRVGRCIVTLKHEWMIFWRQIYFLRNQEGFLTIFWHDCSHSRIHRELPDCQRRGI